MQEILTDPPAPPNGFSPKKALGTLAAILQAPPARAEAPAQFSVNSFYGSLFSKLVPEVDVDGALLLVLGEMAALLKPTRAFIALLNDEGEPVRHVMWGEQGEFQRLFPHSSQVVAQVRKSRQMLWIADTSNSPEFPPSRSILALGIQCVIAVPITLLNEFVGLVYLECDGLRQGDANQTAVLDELARSAGFVVAYARTQNALSAKLEKYQIINQVSLAITATIHLEQLLRLILQHSLALSDGDQGYILLGSEADNLQCLASLNRDGAAVTDVQISRSLTARCMRENRNICILDTSQDEQSQSASVMALDLRSVMCIQLIANNERIGILYLSSNAITKTFTEQDQSLLESIATQAALTIRNAQLLQEQEAQILKLEEALEMYRKAETAANTDLLTALPNRRHFQDQSIREIELALRHNRALAVIILDVDHFKKFNDTYGHAVGDEVLVAMGKVLRETVRAYDVPARLGGEEFVVLLPDTDAPQAATVAERIREAVMGVRLADADGNPVRQLTASFGVASWQSSDREIALTLERADAALYVAKAQGRNQVQIWRDGVPSPESLKQQEAH